jgi:hypothetical protein
MRDSPLLLEREAAAGDGLDEAEPIEAGPGTLGQARRHHGGGVAALMPQAPPCALRNSLQLKGDPIDPPQGVALLSRHGQHGGHPVLSCQEAAGLWLAFSCWRRARRAHQ